MRNLRNLRAQTKMRSQLYLSRRHSGLQRRRLQPSRYNHGGLRAPPDRRHPCRGCITAASKCWAHHAQPAAATQLSAARHARTDACVSAVITKNHNRRRRNPFLDSKMCCTNKMWCKQGSRRRHQRIAIRREQRRRRRTRGVEATDDTSSGQSLPSQQRRQSSLFYTQL